jgi:hypothetical protein
MFLNGKRRNQGFAQDRLAPLKSKQTKKKKGSSSRKA